MSSPSSSQAQAQAQAQGIDITTLPVQQLSQLQSRLSQELEHLSTSYQRLRAAQTRFKDCIRSIKDGVEGKAGEIPLLIPLTSSLYVPAKLNPKKENTVLVDVGTGFYVEKSTTDAIKFYTGKVDDLTRNLGEIEKAVGGKNDNLRSVEDVLRQKVLSGQAQAGQTDGDENAG